MTKLGTGTLTLTGASTYTGATTISAGTLQLGNGTTGNDGTISSTSVVDNGTLAYNVFSNQAPGYTISGTGGLNVLDTGTTKGTVTLSGNNSYAGLTNIGSTTNTGNTLILTGNNTTTGNVFLHNGNTLQLQANAGNTTGGYSSALGNNPAAGSTGFIVGDNTSGSTTIQLRGDNTVAFANTTTGDNSGFITLNIDVNNLGTVGDTSANNTLTFAPASETGRNSGQGLTTYATTINATGGNGYTLAIGGIKSFGSFLNLNANTANITLGSLGESGSTAVTVGGADNTLVTGPISNAGGTLTLTKTGAGTLTLTGTNTYTGTTTISGGTVQLGDGTSGDDGTIANSPSVVDQQRPCLQPLRHREQLRRRHQRNRHRH